MAREERKAGDASVVGRLAERGEEAMNRLTDELGRNSKVTEAVARALAAKGMLDSASRTALLQVGLAPAEDVRELRRRVHDLERRLAELEGGAKAKRPARRTTKKALPKKASPASAETARTTTVRKTAAEKTARTPRPRGT